jgi:ADP-ribosylglycohydrolase
MGPPDANKFAGCLIGQCLGDALGFIVEGQPTTACRSYVDDVVRTGNAPRLGRGRYPFGQYSDDSQLARELVLSIVDRGKFDAVDYAGRIAALFREDRIVGRGLATQAAADRLIRGVPWNEAGAQPPSAGNGSAMRAGPVGLFCFGHSDDLVRTAHDQGRITHKDRRCSAGAIAIAGAVALNLQEKTPRGADFVTRLSVLVEPFDPILARGLQRIPQWLCQSPTAAASEISKTGVAPGFDDGWQGISPFVTASVLWSIYSFLRSPDDYMESICTAIAVGGDVDTTAAMTGAMSGALVGLDRLPRELAQQVNDAGTWGHDELVRLAHRYHSVATWAGSTQNDVLD